MLCFARAHAKGSRFICAADMELFDSENHESLERIETYISCKEPTGPDATFHTV